MGYFGAYNAVPPDSEASRLAIVMLRVPAETNATWPSIHTDETDTNSIVTAHRKSTNHEEGLHKRSATINATLDNCEGELCILYNNDEMKRLNDGDPVFQDKRLLCMSTEEGLCLRTRSLVARQSGCPDLQHIDCANLQGGICNAGVQRITATCMHNDNVCDVTINPSQELVVCGRCTVSYNAGQVTYTSEGQTSNSPINDDCPEISSSGTPWYRTTAAIAGFATAGFVLVCVAPCVACSLCICCGCFACCQGCAMCAKPKTTVNTKVHMQPVSMQPMSMESVK